MIERDPTHGGDLGIDMERGPGPEGENEGSDRDGREHRGSGNHVVQTAGELLARRRKPHFLLRLAYGGRDEIGVLNGVAAAGKCHVARPGISGALSPADQEQAVRVGGEQHRYGSPDEGTTRGVYLRLMMGEALSEPEEPGSQCWWP